jgi:hypothetical protein
MTRDEKLTEAISWLDPYTDASHFEECDARNCDENDCYCPRDEATDEINHTAVCDCTIGAIQKAVALIRSAQEPGAVPKEEL